MATVSIKIENAEQIRRAYSKSPALMTKSLTQAIRKAVFLIQGRATSNAPSVTGRLRGSAYSRFYPMKGEVGFKAKYAAAVHNGYGAFDIYPKGKKALFWTGAGHPVRRVRHPGYAGNPFLQKAVDEKSRDVNNFLARAVQDVLNEIGDNS